MVGRGLAEYAGLNAAAISTADRTGIERPISATGAIVPSLAGMSAEVLAASYAACANTVRARARNFYHGLRLTPEPRRGAIYSIYTWMRAADDLADAPASAAERRLRLGHFREQTERVLSGQRPAEGDEAFWSAFGATCASYPIQHGIFTDMLDGLDDDLETVAYRDDEQLHRYCYRVAGTAGLACLWIWGLREGADPEQARELALRRGQAFQRTNILRDFAQDYDATPSRVYIPADAFSRRGLTPAAVRAWERPDDCAALVLEQAAMTREHYKASDALESLIDPECSPTLWAMTRIYSGLLELIEREPQRIASDRRIRLTGTKKASIALGAALWAKVGRW